MLQAAGMGELTEAGVGLLLQPGRPSARTLRELDISRCPRIGKLVLDLVGRGRVPSALCSLKATGCLHLRRVRLRAPSGAGGGLLTTVNFAGCPVLQELELSAARLETLNLSGCRGLQHLALDCPALLSLQAAQCAKLQALAEPLGVPALRSLDLFSCRALLAPAVAALAAHCPGLQHMKLGGCIHLGPQLQLQLEGLLQLDVSGCQSLLRLEVASPACHTLSARGCSQLQQASVDASALKLLDLTNCGQLQNVVLPRRRPGARAGELAGGAAPQVGPGQGGSRAGGGAAAGALQAPPPRLRLRVVLDGCPRLPPAFSTQLEAARAAAAGAGTVTAAGQPAAANL